MTTVGDNGESAAEAALRDGGMGALALPPFRMLLLLMLLLLEDLQNLEKFYIIWSIWNVCGVQVVQNLETLEESNTLLYYFQVCSFN